MAAALEVGALREPGRGSMDGESGTDEGEVVAKAPRRRFTAEYKRRVLREAEGCRRPGEVSALLRREGLYSSHLAAWRAARERGELAALGVGRGVRQVTCAGSEWTTCVKVLRLIDAVDVLRSRTCRRLEIKRWLWEGRLKFLFRQSSRSDHPAPWGAHQSLPWRSRTDAGARRRCGPRRLHPNGGESRGASHFPERAASVGASWACTGPTNPQSRTGRTPSKTGVPAVLERPDAHCPHDIAPGLAHFEPPSGDKRRDSARPAQRFWARRRRSCSRAFAFSGSSSRARP